MAVTNVDPATLAASWKQNLSAASDRMKAGVMSVTTPPGQAAAAASGRWLAAVTGAEGRYRQNVAAVPLQSWQDSYVNKGLPRVASGAAAAQDKFAATLGKILQAEKTIVSSLPARGDVEQNIARSADFIRKMAAQRGNFKS